MSEQRPSLDAMQRRLRESQVSLVYPFLCPVELHRRILDLVRSERRDQDATFAYLLALGLDAHKAQRHRLAAPDAEREAVAQ